MNYKQKVKQLLSSVCQKRGEEGESGGDIWETKPTTDDNYARAYELLNNVIVVRYETLDEKKKPKLIGSDIFSFEEFYNIGFFEALQEIGERNQAIEEKKELQSGVRATSPGGKSKQKTKKVRL